MQAWYLPVKMVELVTKRKTIFDAFVPESGKEKIALKVRLVVVFEGHLRHIFPGSFKKTLNSSEYIFKAYPSLTSYNEFIYRIYLKWRTADKISKPNS